MNRKQHPLVSIVLPVYNGEKYLETSIQSCIDQTLTDWELLIIDDGSVDRSAEIAKEYASKDARIHYYKNEKNLKLPGALNRGHSLAGGQFLTWTSDDNYYRPQALEKMVNQLKETGSSFVFTSFSEIDEEGEEISVYHAPDDYKNAIWCYNVVGACFLYRREVYETIGGYNPELFLCEDYDYWSRIFSAFETSYLDENLYGYRRHGGTLTATKKKGQYMATERMLTEVLHRNDKLTKIDRYYLYRGLHRSCSLHENWQDRYRYLIPMILYRIWHLAFYHKR